MRKIGWQNGTLVEKAKVTIDGTVYEVEPEEYDGQTALSAENFIQMENNVEDAINTVQSNLNTTNQNIENLTTYSTTEEEVVGTWIDGKPIYRKVVVENVSNFSDTLNIDLGTSNVDVFIDGKVLINTADFTAIDHTATSTSYNMARWVFNKSTNEVQIYNNLQGGITGTIYVIIEYTKTTD